MTVSMEAPEPVESNTPEVGEYENFGISEPSNGPDTPADNAGGGDVRDNPKWEPFLKTIPEPFHPDVKKYLAERDRDVNSRFQEIHQQYAPYKQFQDQGVDPGTLMGAYQMAQQMRSNPVAFFEQYKNALMQQGYLPQEAANIAADAANQAQQQSPSGEQDDPYLAEIQSLKESLEERDQRLAEFFEEQQQAELEQQYLQEESQRIEDDFATIEQRVGKLSGPIKAQILEKAMVMGQQFGRPVSVPEAAQAVFAFIQQARSSGRPAPSTIPRGGGSAVVPPKDPAEMSLEERRAFAEQFRPQG